MNELHAWLDKLGSMSVSDIRKLLQGEGIKGHASSQECPIARYLTIKCGHVVEVDGAHAFVSPDFNWTRLPESVAQFITNFDAALYPELSDGTVSQF